MKTDTPGKWLLTTNKGIRETVTTSRLRRLWAALCEARDTVQLYNNKPLDEVSLQGLRVGVFSIDWLKRSHGPDDQHFYYIVAGCHTIHFSEVERVARMAGLIEPVDVSA